MEDVLEVYSRPLDPNRPLVCLDEFCKQLLSEVSDPLPVAPGRPAREDYEYVREGCVSAFMIAMPLEGRREVFVGPEGRRTAIDYALALRHLAEIIHPGAERIVLVQDNLNTHGVASLYEAFPPEEARRLASRFEVHYTPKHGSWLNIAEIEISVLTRACLSRRIPSPEFFRAEISAYLARKNTDPSPTRWRFTCADARIKLASLYPQIKG
jgi:hypothetical protein